MIPEEISYSRIAYYSGIAADWAYDLPHTPGHFQTSLTFDGMEGKNNISRLELLYGKVLKRGKDASFQPFILRRRVLSVWVTVRFSYHS